MEAKTDVSGATANLVATAKSFLKDVENQSKNKPKNIYCIKICYYIKLITS